MSDELQFGYQVRQALDRGTAALDPSIARRLDEARELALARRRAPVTAFSLAGLGRFAADSFSGRGRGLFAALAVILGAGATYYWNGVDQAMEQQASEYAQLDSALLADEVPFAAYLDQGFMEWLNHLSQEEDSLPQ